MEVVSFRCMFDGWDEVEQKYFLAVESNKANHFPLKFEGVRIYDLLDIKKTKSYLIESPNLTRPTSN